MLVHVDLETSLIALHLPVGDGVAHAVQKGTAPQVYVCDQHAAEVTKVRYFVAASAESEEEFDGSNDGNIRAHGDSHGKGKKPNATVRKEDRVGHENSENGPRSTDRWNIGRPVPPKHGDRLDKHLYQAGPYTA